MRDKDLFDCFIAFDLEAISKTGRSTILKLKERFMTPLARSENLVIQETAEELLVYDLRAHRAVCLNETSALVWQSCDGTKSVSDIRQIISDKFKSPVDDEFIWFALDQLKQENLIDYDEDTSANFNGVSRRNVIKRIGLATMIAIPIVTSLAAPKAAEAASTCITQTGACTCGSNSLFAPPGTICTGTIFFGGLLAMACANPACRCQVNFFGLPNSDNCVP